ncbi:MAG: hypothetical protein ACPL7B_14545 [Candidatus Poribacteria bacterium]
MAMAKNKVTNEYLDRLIKDIKSDDIVRRQKAQLTNQPGDYDASSYELDMIVDIVKNIDGSVGASLTGAGFGGNVLAIVQKDENIINELKNALLEKYYKPLEQDELAWFENDPSLKSVYGDDFYDVKSRIKEIINKKQSTKYIMEKADLEFLERVQSKINTLHKEGKINREIMFIPANYYVDGVVINITADKAGVL